MREVRRKGNKYQRVCQKLQRSVINYASDNFMAQQLWETIIRIVYSIANISKLFFDRVSRVACTIGRFPKQMVTNTNVKDMDSNGIRYWILRQY